MIAFRSFFTVAAGALVLASCASAEREDSDPDRQVDELGTIQQQPSSAVCSEAAGARFRCKAHIRTDSGNHIKPFATPSGLGPADLASAYKLDASKQPSVKVAIVDAFAYPNADSDLAMYRSTFGLPPCTVANGCLVIDNSQGAGNAPANDDWTVEAALDLDLVSAACPSCKIILINAKDDRGDGLFTAQAQAANAGAVAISNSWGGPSDGNDLAEDTQFFTHPGVNIFVATGDNGNTGATPDYPSTSPRVIGVGGTSLTKSSNARGWTEGAWSGAGSSCSKLETKPAYQSVVPAAACGKRAASDVSAVADPNTGLAVYNKDAGGWIVVGGTSAASPFVAGVYARYGIAATNDPTYAYSHASQFFDVTTGSNGTCSSALCKAGAGWDGPTGLGTPNGASLGGGGGGGTCTPNCSGKTCGDDGCGGTCGSCGNGQTCSPGGTCTGGGGCDHPICSTGTKLTASCDPCAQQICAQDSFCCSNKWDSQCVSEVKSVCGQTCGTGGGGGGGGGGSTCTHSECASGTKLTKGCNACVTAICAQDSFCCSSNWDSQCVSEVSSICDESCN